ncbi:MAG: hypothetical protein J6N15_12445 [Ruminiclostridium sp.]|nr:hypothetical protein [Ruminiclostridium sp.]
MNGYISEMAHILKGNIKTAITRKYDKGDTDLNTLGDFAMRRFLGGIGFLKKQYPELSPGQYESMKRFFARYGGLRSDKYHRAYTYFFGRFSPYFLPEDFHFNYVDKYMSAREEARYLDNKCYYYRLLSNVKQPELVTMRIGGTWLDSTLKPVSRQTAAGLASAESEVVLKRAVNSEEGAGVHFLTGAELETDFERITSEIPCDIVLQRPVKQHPDIAALHEQSVNTLRIVSLMTEERVKIYKVCIKIGVGDSRLDNGASGGIYCGVNPDGTLHDHAIRDDGEVFYTHPTLGYEFAGKKVPCLKSALKLAREAHSFLGHFRLISWDIAIDETGEAVLIEPNFTLGGISLVQMCSGPLFGKDTPKILDEVFGAEKRR